MRDAAPGHLGDVDPALLSTHDGDAQGLGALLQLDVAWLFHVGPWKRDDSLGDLDPKESSGEDVRSGMQSAMQTRPESTRCSCDDPDGWEHNDPTFV